MDNVTTASDVDAPSSMYNSVEQQYRTVNGVLLISSSALFGVGTVLNLWFVIAILSSAPHRVRLRNQLLCNLSIFHLGVSLVKSPVLVFYSKLLLRDFQWYNLCDSLTLAVRLAVVSNFSQDCFLFLIVTVYLCSVAGLDPSKWLWRQPGVMITGKLILHLLPWAASPALIPLVEARLLQDSEWCISPLWDEIQHGVLVIITVPVLACIVITSVAFAVSRCRSGSSSRNSTMADQPTPRRRGYVDQPLVYMVAVLVSLACETLLIVSIFMIATQKSIKMVIVSSACGVSQSRSVLMLLPWLLLPDIRDRLKGWRPWQGTSAGPRPAPRSIPGPGLDSQRENLALQMEE